MNREDSKKYLQMLGHELQKKQVTGEILLADDVVMLLDIGKPQEPDIDAYMAYLRGDGPPVERNKGIDAYFGGQGIALREAVADIAKREGLVDNWLNDALKEIFCSQPVPEKWIEYPGLRIYLAPADYMLAMKVATASCPQDIEDIKILAARLPISNAQDMLSFVTKYIPEQLLTSNMRSTIEQIFLP